MDTMLKNKLKKSLKAHISTCFYGLVWVCVLLVSPLSTHAQDARLAYVARYKDIAIKEMERAGVPASIKLAQGLLESGAGRSLLSREANNHFGIKCHSDWTGETFYLEDDDRDGSGQIIKSCFRVYKNADESFVAHSDFLRGKQRYAALFQLDRKDYISWANGLLKAGYATSPDYAEKLIGIIEDLQLNRFDEGGNNDPILVTKPQKRNQNNDGIFYNNDVKATMTDGKISLEQLAGRFGVSVSALRDYNECVKDTRSPLPDSMIIYLQSKNSYSHDRATKYHYVRRGETMCSIAQRYGIDLEKLYKKNNMPFGTEPAANERLILRRSNIFGLWLESWDMPKLRNKNEQNETNEPDFHDPVRPSVPTPPQGNKPTTQRPKPEKEKPKPPQKTQHEEDTLFEIEPNEIKSTPTTPPSKPKVPPTPQEPFETEPTPNKPTPPSTNTNNNVPTSGLHVVAKGETLWSISRKYNISIDVLKRLNNLTTNSIAVGQRLKVK